MHIKNWLLFLKSDRATRLGDFNVVLLTSFLERLIDNNESIQIGNTEFIDIAIMKFNVNCQKENLYDIDKSRIYTNAVVCCMCDGRDGQRVQVYVRKQEKITHSCRCIL